MPVSGLVVHLSVEPPERDDALAAIHQESCIATGILEDNQLAIVLDTTSDQEDAQVRNWLDSLAGVVFVQVAFVGFEDQVASPTIRTGQTPTAAAVSIKECLQHGR